TERQSGNVQHRAALARTTQKRGQHDDQRKPESSRQEHQAGGIDWKSLTEMLDRRSATDDIANQRANQTAKKEAGHKGDDAEVRYGSAKAKASKSEPSDLLLARTFICLRSPFELNLLLSSSAGLKNGSTDYICLFLIHVRGSLLDAV
ncbi:MAG: hypothetical protein KGI63_08565, partial [Xanthomonadaceae bacterium]|nr:hypothetical protein [Xanthomonadaceae bacterium]